MAEAILRQKKRRTDRWMPQPIKHIVRVKHRAAQRFVLQCIPGCLLSFADVLGIPSGFHAAYGAALAATGHDVRPVLTGSALALLLRLCSGLPPRWESLLGMAVIAAAPLLLADRGNWALSLLAGAAMLPAAIKGAGTSTAAAMIQGWAAPLLAALSAPVMARAIKCLKGNRPVSSAEERIAAGYLAAVCICGGARLLLLGFNVGTLLAGGVVLSMALALGCGPAAIAGMLAGVMLALQGQPLTLSVSLAMGGFLAGTMNCLGKRRLICGAFAAGAYLPLLLCGDTGLGCGTAVLGAALAQGLLPPAFCEQQRQFWRRFQGNEPMPGDAYAAAALHSWEQTISTLARSVPSPQEENAHRNAAWWQEKLCQGCPEYEACGCLRTPLGMSKAEAVWEYRYADEQIWQDALEHLRGMGCQRLYYLIGAMNALRQEDEAGQRVIRQAEMQRNMLVTHLLALSGAARRFAALSAGENWRDAMAAKRIRKALAERAIPTTLTYVRCVQGHVQAAFELHFITGARKQAEDLSALVSAVLEIPLQLASIDGDRLLLMEKPLLRAEIGTAAEAITDGEVCGDTAWWGRLQDGRYLVILADGMGHGAEAALFSRQTAELLRLCMEAGYTRQQVITAVNGMLMLGGGERFAAADVLTIDLWQGESGLDKMGAASSWVYQRGALTRITGSALPLGILDEIEQEGNMLQLADGDAVVLMSDGVEDAFRSVKALETAIMTALICDAPGKAAENLLAAAWDADDHQRRDDQSVVVVYIRRASNPGFTAGAARDMINGQGAMMDEEEK